MMSGFELETGVILHCTDRLIRLHLASFQGACTQPKRGGGSANGVTINISGVIGKSNNDVSLITFKPKNCAHTLAPIMVSALQFLKLISRMPGKRLIASNGTK